jgi:hypothetical protein
VTDQAHRHLEAAEAANAKAAALPRDERLASEAANAPYLRIQLAYALKRAEEAERARKDLADQAYPDDSIEFVVWSALDQPLQHADVVAVLKTIRHCRVLAAEALNVCADTWKDTEKRLKALHKPVQHMGKTWCAECSVRRSTGPHTEEWVAYIPHPCPTLEALDGKEAAP